MQNIDIRSSLVLIKRRSDLGFFVLELPLDLEI